MIQIWDRTTRTTLEFRDEITDRIRSLINSSDSKDGVHCSRAFPVNLSQAQRDFTNYFLGDKLSIREFRRLNLQANNIAITFSENCWNKILI